MGVLVVFLLFVSGTVCGMIAASRGNSFGWFFLLGVLFPLFGLLAALFYIPRPRERRLPARDEPGYDDPI